MTGTRTLYPAAFAKAAEPAGDSTGTGPRVWLCDSLVGACIALSLLWTGQSPSMATPLPVAAPVAHALPMNPSVVSDGVVLGIHEFAVESGSGERRYELTILLKDGSLQVSNHAGSPIWSPGDKVRLIGPQAIG